MFDLNTVVEREDSFALELFPAETTQFRQELDRFFTPVEKQSEVTNEIEEETMSRFMLDLGEAVAEFVSSGVGQAMQFVRNEDARLAAIDLSIEDSEDGLIYDPHDAEMIMFDIVDSDGNSYKKIFHMLTEQVQVFYE